MKVGIIRCMQTEDYCPGTNDFKMVTEKKGAFEGVEEPIEIAAKMKEIVKKEVGEEIRILDYTH